MTTYQGNSSGSKAEPLSDIMAAYDSLPSLVRLAVSFAPVSISPIDVAKYKNQFPPQQLAEAVLREGWTIVGATFTQTWGRAPHEKDLMP